MSDSKKDAVNIGVTLSTQLISASLTMIAVLGAFATFIIDKRDIGFLYYSLIGASFLSFVASIFIGSKGIDKARKDGFDDKWNLTETKSAFNFQALFCALGLLFFISSIFIGKEKDNNELDRITKTEKEIYSIKLIDSLRQGEVNKLKDEIKLLNGQLDELRATVHNSTLPKAGQTEVKKP